MYKNILKIICIVAFLCISSCALLPLRDMTAARCSRSVERAAQKLEMGSLSYDDLVVLNEGESGFFYILSPDGILLLHPHGALAGSDFSKVPSVQAMLAKDRGVQSDQIGGVSRTVFFRRLSSGNMLCLSLDTDELKEE